MNDMFLPLERSIKITYESIVFNPFTSGCSGGGNNFPNEQKQEKIRIRYVYLENRQNIGVIVKIRPKSLKEKVCSLH